MRRLLRNLRGRITVELHKADGDPVDATGTVNVVVKDGAGAQIATGNAVQVAGQTGGYEFFLTPAQLATLDVFAADWTATVEGVVQTFTTEFRTVGAHYFTVGELRALDAKLADATKYPTAKIVAERDQAAEDLEEVCEVGFVRLGRRETLDATGTADIGVSELFPRKLVSASISGTTLGAQKLTEVFVYEHGLLRRDPGVGDTWTATDEDAKAVVVHYEHGYSERPPERIKRAAMVLTRSRLIPDTLPDRATSVIGEQGTFILSTAGRRGSHFGIPDVDAAVDEFDHSVPAVG